VHFVQTLQKQMEPALIHNSIKSFGVFALDES